MSSNRPQPDDHAYTALLRHSAHAYERDPTLQRAERLELLNQNIHSVDFGNASPGHPPFSFQSVDFSGSSFRDCTFPRYASGMTLGSGTADHCSLTKTEAYDLTVEDFSFTDCRLSRLELDRSRLTDVTFACSDLIRVGFRTAYLERITFEHSSMELVDFSNAVLIDVRVIHPTQIRWISTNNTTVVYTDDAAIPASQRLGAHVDLSSPRPTVPPRGERSPFVPSSSY